MPEKTCKGCLLLYLETIGENRESILEPGGHLNWFMKSARISVTMLIDDNLVLLLQEEFFTLKHTYMKQIRQFFQSRTRLTKFLCCLILGTLLSSLDARAQTWTAITNTAPHVNQGVMLLLTDGTVMCKTSSGGGDGYGNTWDKLTPNASGSYVSGTWSSLAPMASTRLYFSSQILRDGRVYVCGGEYGTGGYKGEVYNPLTNSWINTPTHSAFVSDANSEILEDGRVLQALVWAPATTKLYNPATNTYVAGPTALGSNNETAWLKLPDNSILYVTVNSTQSQRYIPATNTWISDANCAVNLYDPYGSEMGGAWLLPDGRGFFVGATGHTAFYTPSGTTAPGTWAAGPDLPGGKAVPDGPGAMMTDGKLLLAVSPAPTAANHFPTPTTFYIYDYLTNTYASIVAPGGGASLAIPCYETSMLQLPNGQVMFGRFGQSQYYVFTPAGAPLAAGKPTISGITLIAPNTYRITGTRFNGICQGANYGDDWQMSTNYPVIRVVNGASTFYCRSYNWNSFGVRRGAALDTAYFTTPAGLPNATYNLFVTANGNPSNAATFVPNLVASVDIAVSSGNNPGCDGTSVTFQATPNNGGGSPTYQWKLNGINISGATNSSYTTTTSVQGDLITCVMTASIVVTGSPAASNTITMTINDNNIVLTSAASPTSICAGASTNLTVTSNYCQPVYTTGTSLGDYVGRVTLSGTTLNNITVGASSPYYTLYPASGATTATLTAGATYTMTLSAGTFATNNNLAAWIDYNQDKSLNVDEKLGQVLAIGAYPASGTIVFTVPASAKNGSVRLRVREIYFNSNLDPCKTASFGETEDYVITITGGGAASAIVYDWSAGTSPASGTSVNASPEYSQAYTVTVTDVHGCTTSSSVPVVVNSPNFTTSSTPPTLCSGATSSLAAAKITNTYCNPQSTYGSTYGDYITLVNISGTTLNNPTGASGAPYYTLYPASGSTTTTLTAGGTYSLILSAGSYPSYNSIAAFIDYDQNSLLNTGLEKLGETGYISASPASATITFTVPLWAKNGSARLRVREVYATLGIDPCNAVFYGETEDYVLTITGGVTETPYTYAWSAGTTPSTGTPVSVTPLVTSIYTVTATDQYACTSTRTTSVVVNSPAFTVNPASPAVLCEGLSSTLSVTATAPAYCQPIYYNGTTDGDYIGNVSISLTTLDNTTLGSVSPYYTLFPASGSTTASLVAGNTYTINLSPGTFPANNNLTAWIDYDQNGLFLSGLEKLGEAVNVSPYPGSTSFVFTVPAWAKNGTARLRVKEVFYYTNIDPCALNLYGETEDYDLTITGGAATDVYTWSAGTTPSTGDLVSVTPAYSQSYTVTATDGYGCTKTGTTSVLVNSPAFLSTATPPEICAGASSSLTAISNYCQPTYVFGTGSGDYITLVSIASTSLNNPTGASGSPYYTLYPASGATTATLSAGTTYTITLSPGTYSSNNNLAAWIDYDHNTELSNGIEKLGETGWVTGLSSNTFVFTVPAWAQNGQTRLRVREVYFFTGLTSCTGPNDYYGETEDYVITITGGIAAAAPAIFSWSPGTTPAAGSPVSVTPAFSQSYTVTATDAFGCTRTGTVPVVVHDLPGVVATSAPSTICSGGSSILTASAPSLPAYCVPTYYSGTGAGDYCGSVAIVGTTLNNVTAAAASPFYNLYPASGQPQQPCMQAQRTPSL
ncbi:putative cell agglutination protein 1742.01 [Filimonas sp.]|nr:putative cell agglutination protein 1742.01 [Filimonas sp.]